MFSSSFGAIPGPLSGPVPEMQHQDPRKHRYQACVHQSQLQMRHTLLELTTASQPCVWRGGGVVFRIYANLRSATTRTILLYLLPGWSTCFSLTAYLRQKMKSRASLSRTGRTPEQSPLTIENIGTQAFLHRILHPIFLRTTCLRTLPRLGILEQRYGNTNALCSAQSADMASVPCTERGTQIFGSLNIKWPLVLHRGAQVMRTHSQCRAPNIDLPFPRLTQQYYLWSHPELVHFAVNSMWHTRDRAHAHRGRRFASRVPRESTRNSGCS